MSGFGYFSTPTYYYKIDTIFYNHGRGLQEKILEAQGEIDAWAATLRFQIDEHVKTQKKFLQQCYDEQQHALEARKDEFMTTARRYYDRNDYEQINELLRQCQALKFELLIAFDYEDRSLSFIKYMKKEQLEENKRQESNTTNVGNNRLETPSTSKDHRTDDKTRESHIGSSYEQTYVSGQPTNGSSSTSKSATTYDHSTSGNASQNDQTTGSMHNSRSLFSEVFIKSFFMSRFSLFGYTIGQSRSEKEINTLFQYYEKTLSGQKSKMLNDIGEWQDSFIHVIRQHAEKQIYRLEQEYDNEVRYLKQQCKLFIDELYRHEETNKAEKIDQLLDRCKALKFELAALEYIEQPIPLIQVTQRESVNIKLDKLEIIERRNKSSTQNSLLNDQHKAYYTGNAYENSYSTATFANVQQTE
ncbi:unnamed protein product [Rotaria sp. Silwood2]|nr:unnamed protein product [Rotaria sp. Silwood2]CAF4435723.1 unnamed protein product [Rotaria sp. Silwood2]